MGVETQHARAPNCFPIVDQRVLHSKKTGCGGGRVPAADDSGRRAVVDGTGGAAARQEALAAQSHFNVNCEPPSPLYCLVAGL